MTKLLTSRPAIWPTLRQSHQAQRGTQKSLSRQGSTQQGCGDGEECNRRSSLTKVGTLLKEAQPGEHRHQWKATQKPCLRLSAFLLLQARLLDERERESAERVQRVQRAKRDKRETRESQERAKREPRESQERAKREPRESQERAKREPRESQESAESAESSEQRAESFFERHA